MKRSILHVSRHSLSNNDIISVNKNLDIIKSMYYVSVIWHVNNLYCEVLWTEAVLLSVIKLINCIEHVMIICQRLSDSRNVNQINESMNSAYFWSGFKVSRYNGNTSLTIVFIHIKLIHQILNPSCWRIESNGIRFCPHCCFLFSWTEQKVAFKP